MTTFASKDRAPSRQRIGVVVRSVLPRTQETQVSFASQRFQWIDCGRASCRRPAGEQRDAGEQQSRADQCGGIGRLHFKEERLEYTRYDERTRDADHDAARNEAESFAKNEIADVTAMGADRRADRDLSAALGGRQ